MRRLLFCLLAATLLYGQIESYTGISVADESNPAWLLSDYSSDFQNFGIILTRGSGNFRLTFEPDKISEYNYIATGEKQLFANGVFSGYVAFHQQQLGGKMWVHNRNPYLGFPFLLADSSTGTFQLNGIHWQLGYSHQLLAEKMHIGGQLFYNVDEEMKDIFPKPIVRHRNFSISIGVGYQINPQFQCGLNYSYFNFQEQAKTGKYSLEQDKTPLFFKIRGLDNPLVFRGETSEERKQNFQGHNLKFDSGILDWIAEEINFLGEAEIGKIDAVDGGAYPIKQGTMDMLNLFFKGDAIFEFFGHSWLKINVFGKRSLFAADHPDLQIEIYAHKREYLGAGLELFIPITKQFEIQPQIFGSSQYFKREDKFNGILDYFPSTGFGGAIGFDVQNAFKTEHSFELGYKTTTIGDEKIFAENTGWYYTEITHLDEIYFGTDSYQYWIDYHINYQFKQNRFIIVEVKYQSHVPTGSNVFDDYKELVAGLKFEIRK